jgi:transposase
VIPGISSVVIWSPISPERDRTHEEALFGRTDHWLSAGWGSGNRGEGFVPQARFSEAGYYLWESKFGGMSVSDAKRLKELETENARLKKLVAESVLENEVAREALRKKW